MPRPKKNPGFDADVLLAELMDAVVEAYENGETLLDIAEEMKLSTVKVRKLLITAGERQNRPIYVYKTKETQALAGTILALHKEGRPVSLIMAETGLKQAAVYAYLPYSSGAYNMRELSTAAGRVKLHRERMDRCRNFSAQIAVLPEREAEGALWEMLEYLQGCVFYTNRGLRFRYAIRGGEMFVDRREKSKSLTKSTVFLAFHNARRIQESEGCVNGPKKLGTFGASYLYPIFLRLGICQKEGLLR